MAKVHEGWMVRYGRRKIGRSYIHKRYFVLESRLLAYYKREPQDNVVPIKTLLIDGNCRVEDRGLKTHHGHMVYVLSIYNKKEKNHRITQQDSLVANGNKTYSAFDFKSRDDDRTASSSDRESQFSAQEDEDVAGRTLVRRITIGNGPPDSVLDWTRETNPPNPNNNDHVFSRKHWRLIRCQNGLRIFEELIELDYLPRSCSTSMKAVGVVEASCEAVFELVMGMDARRFEWDCSFQYGSLVEEVDGHTAILYHRLQLDWFPMEHPNCGPQPGFVRAHIESGGFTISSLSSRHGRPRTRVQHLMQIDLKGWGVGYLPSFKQHCLLQMLNSVAGLREWFCQTEENHTVSRIPVIASMQTNFLSSKKGQKQRGASHRPTASLDQMPVISQDTMQLDEDSDEDGDYQFAEQDAEQEAYEAVVENEANQTVEGTTQQIELSLFTGNLRRDDRDMSRDCWRISDGNNFRVRSKHFLFDKSKVPAGKPIMELVAVDWFKDVKRMDHVARRQGCAVQVASEKGLFSLAINLQVPGSTHYSMVFYFVTAQLIPGSLLQRFVDGDDEFRNTRLKLIPSVPKGSWIVRQSVGSTPCLLGKAVDCTYIRESKYLEIDVDIGSSTVANGVLGLVCGVITTLMVDMAFLIQGNTLDELPERLIGAVRVSHVELSSAINPGLPEVQPTEP
ncbi:unnamed protein product [Victoria cruziana]